MYLWPTAQIEKNHSKKYHRQNASINNKQQSNETYMLQARLLMKQQCGIPRKKPRQLDTINNLQESYREKSDTHLRKLLIYS